MTDQQIAELHAAQDEMAEAAQTIKTMFHRLAEILDHERWGCFGDGVTHINYQQQSRAPCERGDVAVKPDLFDLIPPEEVPY